MKHVQVFQLRDPVTMAIPESSREIQYHSMSSRPPAPLIGGEPPHYALPVTETVTCPVHCLKHAIKESFVASYTWSKSAQEWVDLQYGPGYVHDPEQDIWVKTQYIAMEPELFKMLDTVVRQPYEEREQVRAARLDKSEEQVHIMKRVIDNFWAMPWYKRAWFAITRDC